jgi:hypothetical protein
MPATAVDQVPSLAVMKTGFSPPPVESGRDASLPVSALRMG